MYKFVFFLVTILSTNLFPEDYYTVDELPYGFMVTGKYSFNNFGQVAGVVNRKPAFWDKNRGMTILQLDEYEASAINDLGMVCCNSIGNSSKIILWDTNNGGLIQGPFGRSKKITNSNDVLILNQKSRIIWNSNSNSIETINSSVILINNNRELFNEFLGKDMSTVDANDHGTILGRSTAGYCIISNGKYTLLSPPFPFLSYGYDIINNFDEVVALVWENTDISGRNLIIMKQCNNLITFSGKSKSFKLLENYYLNSINGFNDYGKILITATKAGTNEKKLFILSPIPQKQL